MAGLKRRLITLAVLFIAVTVFSLFFYYSGKPIHGVLHAKKIPLEVGDWSGIDIPMDEQSMRLLETRDILFRAYTRKGMAPVYLCIVFAQNNRRSIHPPEVCYIASGWEVGEKNFFPSTEFSIEPEFDATKLLITKNYDKQLIYYWFKAGNLLTSSAFKHQLNLALGQILFRNMSGALIRISTEIKNEDRAAAKERLDEFTQTVIPLIQKYLP